MKPIATKSVSKTNRSKTNRSKTNRSKTDRYREILKGLEDWEPFLLAESGLPGKRGNLELAQAVADEGSPALFEKLLTGSPEEAPTDSPQGFLVFCGVVGLGRLAAEGQHDRLPLLCRFANDPRWRIREAVAMALQRLGKVDMDRLLVEMEKWSSGSWLEKRAAAAALAEPVLLRDPGQVARVLDILDRITTSILDANDRRSSGFQALRKGLGYCWSVAVVALPGEGRRRMERWLASQDPDVRWIMKENLKKDRLSRLDKDWVSFWKLRLESSQPSPNPDII